MRKSDFGVIGLGVMGSNLSLNLAENDFKISVYNRALKEETNIVSDFIETNKDNGDISGFTTLQEFVLSLNQPRQILIMIKAGPAIDEVIDSLLPFLDGEDILIDGGNSYYEDTLFRQKRLEPYNIHLIGCGISGGAEGARFGPSLMPSGNYDAFKIVSPILKKIAAKDKTGHPTCAYIGEEGSGHYVKMIHNGIEYGEMQLLAELYALLSINMSNGAIADVFEKWNKTDLKSYLLEISITILRTKINKDYLVDKILDKSGNKGTGFWSVNSSLVLGLPSTMMSSALYARFLSSFKDKRQRLSSSIESRKFETSKPDLKSLKNAYRFARLINHHQGFEILAEKSKTSSWNLNLSELARIWTNGCIIRSALMETIANDFKSYRNLFEMKETLDKLAKFENDSSRLIVLGLQNRIAVDCFYSAHNYWISMTTEKLPANLIQAQRDYFGGHSFERIDKPSGQFFSHNWKPNA